MAAIRKHEIHAGHRVYGHVGKCQHLHGHSYVVHFHCQANSLNDLGMVIDFGLIKTTLCQWLEDNYDHRMLIWENDPILKDIQAIDAMVVTVPYNPTAENIAYYLLTEIAPNLLKHTGISVNKIIVEETSKCRAECEQ
ncbi:MAG: 6-carboxytetrahydropterin synthase [Burkholderiales bacterium]|nr:6-carboxytetrahydropterin synthase [Burkholderiales bacterium]